MSGRQSPWLPTKAKTKPSLQPCISHTLASVGSLPSFITAEIDAINLIWLDPPLGPRGPNHLKCLLSFLSCVLICILAVFIQRLEVWGLWHFSAMAYHEISTMHPQLPCPHTSSIGSCTLQTSKPPGPRARTLHPRHELLLAAAAHIAASMAGHILRQHGVEVVGVQAAPQGVSYAPRVDATCAPTIVVKIRGSLGFRDFLGCPNVGR